MTDCHSLLLRAMDEAPSALRELAQAEKAILTPCGLLDPRSGRDVPPDTIRAWLAPVLAVARTRKRRALSALRHAAQLGDWELV